MATSSNITLNFFTMNSSSSRNSKNKSKFCLQAFNQSSNTNGKTVRLNLDSDLKIKLEAQTLHNGSRVTSIMDSLKVEEMTSPPATMDHLLLGGRLIKGGLVFQQNICIRSFELDHDYKLSTKAIMNYLQEASFSYRKKMGMSSHSLLGITPEMKKRDLIWVFRGMHIEVDRYPSWSDVVQLSHWVYTSGRTGLRFDWTINDIKTGETLVRASCLAVMMNKKTRKTCKLPEEVKEEIKPFLTTDAEPIVEAKRFSSPQVETMDYIRTGLAAGWHDLDFNYHVNNSKYLDWILESVPRSLIYSNELCTINLEYRKECLKDDVIRSLSKVVPNETDDLSTKDEGRIELQHVVCLESGPEVLWARTSWRPKSVCQRNYN